jgi:hypothetical protein
LGGSVLAVLMVNFLSSWAKAGAAMSSRTTSDQRACFNIGETPQKIRNPNIAIATNPQSERSKSATAELVVADLFLLLYSNLLRKSIFGFRIPAGGGR